MLTQQEEKHSPGSTRPLSPKQLGRACVRRLSPTPDPSPLVGSQLGEGHFTAEGALVRLHPASCTLIMTLQGRPRSSLPTASSPALRPSEGTEGALQQASRLHTQTHAPQCDLDAHVLTFVRTLAGRKEPLVSGPFMFLPCLSLPVFLIPEYSQEGLSSDQRAGDPPLLSVTLLSARSTRSTRTF